MEDVLCTQILSSTLMQSCRCDGYELRSQGPGCAASVALLWHGRMGADTNLTLLSDTHALVSFIYLFLSLTFLLSQELARVVCPFGSGHWKPVERTFSATETVIKMTLAGGLRTCPSWCCCCVLLSFPCQQNGRPRE